MRLDSSAPEMLELKPVTFPNRKTKLEWTTTAGLPLTCQAFNLTTLFWQVGCVSFRLFFCLVFHIVSSISTLLCLERFQACTPSSGRMKHISAVKSSIQALWFTLYQMRAWITARSLAYRKSVLCRENPWSISKQGFTMWNINY